MLPDNIVRDRIQFDRRSCGREYWYEVRYNEHPCTNPDGTIRTLRDESTLIGHVHPQGSFGKVFSWDAQIGDARAVGKARMAAVESALKQLGR